MTRLEITVALVAANLSTGKRRTFEGGWTEEEIGAWRAREIKDAEAWADQILASFIAHEEGREWPAPEEVKAPELIVVGQEFTDAKHVGARVRLSDGRTAERVALSGRAQWRVLG